MTNSSIIRGLWLACILLASVSTIQAQSVIVSPTGGEEVMPGKDRLILWDTHNVTGNVSLSLWDGSHGKWSPICSNIPAGEGKAIWHVPSNLTGTKFRVKLSTDAGTLHGSALSQTFFTVGATSTAQRPATQHLALKTLGGTPTPCIMCSAEKRITHPASKASVAMRQAVTLTPNPTQGDVLCAWPGEAREIALIDLLGNIVQRHSLATTTDNYRIATQGLPKGNYYIRVVFLNGTVETHPLAVE
jgi:hypothetical protein